MSKLKWHRVRKAAILLGTIVVAPVMGCSNTESNGETVASTTGNLMAATPPAGVRAPLNATGQPGDGIAKYRLFIPTRSLAETRSRVEAAARILTRSSTKLAENADVVKGWSSPLDNSTLRVSYDPEFDVLTIRDTASATSNVVADIGEASAREQMRSFVGDLTSAGLIKEWQYDLASVTTGHHRRLIGDRRGGEVVRKVMEYRYFVPRKVNGIEVANAAIMVGIDPSGKRSSVRIGGVAVDSTHNGIEERPGATGGLLTRTVSAAEVDGRFAAEVAGNRDVHTSFKGVMYLLPKGARDAVIEPKMVHRYSVGSVAEDGSKAVQKVATASFSLTDKDAPHEVFAGQK